MWDELQTIVGWIAVVWFALTLSLLAPVVLIATVEKIGELIAYLRRDIP